MTGTAQEDIDLLRGAMDGPVIGPADADYDDARKVMNAAIDRRPAVIARCLSATEVSAAIKFARERRWEVSVRGGAHSTAGHGVCDDGLMIDLSQIRHVSVDPQKEGGGAGGGGEGGEEGERGGGEMGGLVGWGGGSGVSLLLGGRDQRGRVGGLLITSELNRAGF